MHTYICIYTYITIHTYIHIYIYIIHRYIYVCIYVCVCVCVYIHTHTHTYIYIGGTKVSVGFVFLGLHPQHMEDLRLGVKSEMQLLAYTTVTETQDPSCFCLHHSSWQRWILNPLSKARYQAHVLMDASQVH